MPSGVFGWLLALVELSCWYWTTVCGCTRGLRDAPLGNYKESTKYEMVGVFSRPLSNDEQDDFKDQIQRLAVETISFSDSRKIIVHQPKFPSSMTVAVPFTVVGEPLSSSELDLMLHPLKQFFQLGDSTERKRRSPRVLKDLFGRRLPV